MQKKIEFQRAEQWENFWLPASKTAQSDKFSKQQAAEREQLQYLIFGMQGLPANAASSLLRKIELSALAALLYSFYTSVENIFSACH